MHDHAALRVFAQAVLLPGPSQGLSDSQFDLPLATGGHLDIVGPMVRPGPSAFTASTWKKTPGS